jgi:hypothetical protein
MELPNEGLFKDHDETEVLLITATKSSSSPAATIIEQLDYGKLTKQKCSAKLSS